MDFLESMGVNQHLNAAGTIYDNPLLELRELRYLGLKLVRDQAPTFSNLPQYQELASAGVKFDLIIGPGSLDVALTLPNDMAAIAALARSRRGSVLSVEGPNELNGQIVRWHGSSSANPAVGISVMRALSRATRADPWLHDVAVVNISIFNGRAGWQEYLDQLGSLAAYVDFANWHVYFDGGSQPLTHVTSMFQNALRSAPGKPVVFTEAGYTSADQGFSGVDEETQATNTLNLLADSYKAGAKYIYLYELMEGAHHPSATDIENRFGLFHSDGTAKSVAIGIHNLTSILLDNATKSQRSDDLPPGYSFSNLPITGENLLLQKTESVYDLMVWDEKRNWDPHARHRIPFLPTHLVVNFASKHRTVAVFDPMKGTRAIVGSQDTSNVTVELMDHPLILEITD